MLPLPCYPGQGAAQGNRPPVWYPALLSHWSCDFNIHAHNPVARVEASNLDSVSGCCRVVVGVHCLAAQGCTKQGSRADVVGLLNPKAWSEAQQVGTVYSTRVLINMPTDSASCIYTSHKVNCTQNRTSLPVLLNQALAVLLMCKGGGTHLAIGNHSIAISINKEKKSCAAWNAHHASQLRNEFGLHRGCPNIVNQISQHQITAWALCRSSMRMQADEGQCPQRQI